MKTSFGFRCLMTVLTLGFLLSGYPAKADGEGEARGENKDKDVVRTKDQPREDGDRRREAVEQRRESPEQIQQDKERPREDAKQRKENRERMPVRSRSLNATLYKVQSSSVLLVGVGDGGKEMRLPVQADTKIFISGVPASITDLKPDMFLRVRQEAGLTRRIDAFPARSRGPKDNPQKGDTRDKER